MKQCSNLLFLKLLTASILSLLFLFPKTSISQHVAGFTFVGVPNKIIESPMGPLSEVQTNSIALVPYGFFEKDKTHIIFEHPRQWWGERREGIIQSIIWAHESDIRVLLKPQLWTHNTWIGEHDFENGTDWEEWEQSYSEFILYYAQLAQEMCVEKLCIGTELKAHIKARPEYYSSLIDTIRSVYHGSLTYSANWDHYDEIPFWDQLDYVGISAYFPLISDVNPSVEKMKSAWKPHVKKMKQFSEKLDKPILFTEYGYLSVDGAAGKTWELESKIDQLAVNQEAQSKAFKALFEVFINENWWAGGYVWKWFPNGQGGEGYNEKDYTPQKKKALQTISYFYEKFEKPKPSSWSK